MNLVTRRGNERACIAQFLNDRIQRARCSMRQTYVATGRGDRRQKSTRLDAVRHYRVIGNMQCVDPCDRNHIGTVALNIGAHFDQTLGKIHDFWLSRGIFEHRNAVGQCRCHHQILGTGHGNDKIGRAHV